MGSETKWTPAGPDIDAILTAYSDPLRALSEARIPALLVRRAYDPTHCQGLIHRFIERGLMPGPEEWAQGKEAGARMDLGRSPTGTGSPWRSDPRTRVDIGTSLGNLGNDQEAFLEHAKETHALFRSLFEGFENPVAVIYDTLAKLAAGKRVEVAREPDGRLYGPAIFRIHYGGHTYKPHIDHVTLREKRWNYAVSRFEHQFAGVLCIQNASVAGETTQAVLHRCLWTPEVQPFIQAGTFHEYAAEHRVPHYRVELEPGDLYFFNTRCIHEVPAVRGTNPRTVLATFIGYSPSDEAVWVWS